MQRIVTLRSVFGAVSAALFIISKIFIVEGIILWVALDNFQVSRISAAILAVVITVPCLWASVKVCIMAWEAETDPVINSYYDV